MPGPRMARPIGVRYRRRRMLAGPEQAYTSTGLKYARHFGMIEALREGRGEPHSLQVSPTNRCNLRCVFCSVDERDLKLEWNVDELAEAIAEFVTTCNISTV